jgi:hypothetical protein
LRFYWLILGTLAVWRITHLLNAEDGPWDIFVRLRRSVGNGFLGRLLDCFYCLSLWIAAPLAYYMGEGWKERLLLWPAMSAAAILLERLTLPNRATLEPPLYLEDPEEENDDVMLREEQRTIHRGPTQPSL